MSVWHTLPQPTPEAADNQTWLSALLEHNRHCRYLAQFGSPRTLEQYRAQVPLCSYEDLAAPIAQTAAGASDVLFAGRPVAYERTGGSSGGSKLIPYSHAGLLDFQRNLLPWLAHTVQHYRLTGTAYFATSPATRQPETLRGVPVGLPDGAYLGAAAGAVLLAQSAVPWHMGQLSDVGEWRKQTVAHLRNAHDLELISVWSPTFLLRLLDDMPEAPACWPRLKCISCWSSGAAARHAQALQQRLPQAAIQPKGLLATEGVVTVPDARNRPVLVQHGFAEFLQGHTLHLAQALQAGQDYEVVLTTASGLYRYRTGDQVRCNGHADNGQPVLEFIGRGSLCSDLVGEKLSEAFVAHCLRHCLGFALLLPEPQRCGYVLVVEQALSTVQLAAVEQALCANPQYAYARRMGQLAGLRLLVQPRASSIVEQTLLAQGTRLGDIKPLALRTQAHWLHLLEQAVCP